MDPTVWKEIIISSAELAASFAGQQAGNAGDYEEVFVAVQDAIIKNSRWWIENPAGQPETGNTTKS